MKYRKKPIVIEAVQYDGSVQEIVDFVGIHETKMDEQDKLYIKTLEGDMLVSHGDYVIKGVQGEFYPCKPDIFEATYVKDNSLSVNVSLTDTDSFKAVVEAFGLLVGKASKEDGRMIVDIFKKYGMEGVSE